MENQSVGFSLSPRFCPFSLFSEGIVNSLGQKHPNHRVGVHEQASITGLATLSLFDQSEVLENYRIGMFLGSRLHHVCPKVADALIKALLSYCRSDILPRTALAYLSSTLITPSMAAPFMPTA
jgi:hypothetical protein